MTVLAEYKCGCTWVGPSDECIECCETHGEDRLRKRRLKKADAETMAEGWSQ